MTQEEKDLLLKDLCARLPYGVHIYNKMNNSPISARMMLDFYHIRMLNQNKFEFIKPYLFPISNMTEEQKKEYESLCIKKTSECTDLYDIIFTKDYYDTVESIDYLYKNHIDIRGLIPLGLAKDATDKKIY